MKFELAAVAALAIALTTPALAVDNAAPEARKADTPTTQRNTPSKRHSHLEDRHGIKPADRSAAEPRPVDKAKHSHPKDR